MSACYIDCSPFMRDLMRDAGLALPDTMRVHVGDPAPGALLDVIGDAEIVLNGHTYMDAALIGALRNVRRIVYLGTGATSYIDVAAAEKRGIEVKTIRGYGDRSVAEHTFALMMDSARQVSRMDREMRAGIWNPLGGVELGGRTLGIVGAGGIGLELAKMASGFGMKILIWNRSALSGDWREHQVSIERLLGDSDLVSLHLALTPETSNFLDAARFGQMRKGTILINTARAGLIDEAALADALECGRVVHAALDVFSQEPPAPGHRFQNLANVTLTSHAAYKTREASLRLMQTALELA